MAREKGYYTKLAVKALVILVAMAATPHLFSWFVYDNNYQDTNFLSKIFDEQTVEYWFSLANDGSLFYIIIPFFILELIRYFFLNKLSWDIIGDSIANIITLVVFIGMEIILGILFLYQLYFWIYEHMSIGYLPMNIVTIVMCILLADFAYYWDHRLMHRIGLGWATHTVHHSSEHFNMSVAYRFGPLDAIFPILFSLPLVVIGFNPWLLLASELFVQTYQAILHTEVIGKFPKPIEYIMNTPSHHRVHHGVNRVYWDKNYAGILIIWDRLFGTFEEEKEIVKYGVTVPIKSNNPLVVFFHGFTRLYEQMRSTKGLKNKLLYLVKPPGWTPNK